MLAVRGMMRRTLGCLALSFGLVVTAAYAEDDQDSAIVLSRICNSGNFFGDGFCRGSVRATVVTYLQTQPDDKFCGFDLKAYPGGALGAFMKKYFATHVIDHNQTALDAIKAALHEAFPCQ